MKLLKLILMMTLLTIASGCSWRFWSVDKPVEVKEGQAAELAYPVDAKCWVTNKATGKRELRKVEAQAGWYIGRIKKK